MKDNATFRAETALWLEANCPASLRTPITSAEMVWGGSQLAFANEDQRLWFERMRARGWRPSFPIGSDTTAPGIALVSAFHWDTGIAAHWSSDRIDLAAAITRGAPARPVTRETNRGLQWSGRAAIMLPAGVTVGVSGARGDWIDQAALDVRPVAGGVSVAQTVVGADASIERGHWIVRAEYLHSTFGIPIANDPSFTTPLAADTGFAEARYRFRSRWQIAARAERLTFSELKGTLFSGAPTPWDAPVKRLEATAAFRLMRTIDVRGGYQYNWREAGRVRKLGLPTLQLLSWFC